MPLQQVYLRCIYTLTKYDDSLCPQCNHRYNCDVVYQHNMQRIQTEAIAKLAAMDDGTCKGCEHVIQDDKFNCMFCIRQYRNYADCYKRKEVTHDQGGL